MNKVLALDAAAVVAAITLSASEVSENATFVVTLSISKSPFPCNDPFP